jgi:hypothetical protein
MSALPPYLFEQQEGAAVAAAASLQAASQGLFGRLEGLIERYSLEPN